MRRNGRGPGLSNYPTRELAEAGGTQAAGGRAPQRAALRDSIDVRQDVFSEGPEEDLRRQADASRPSAAVAIARDPAASRSSRFLVVSPASTSGALRQVHLHHLRRLRSAQSSRGTRHAANASLTHSLGCPPDAASSTALASAARPSPRCSRPRRGVRRSTAAKPHAPGTHSGPRPRHSSTTSRRRTRSWAKRVARCESGGDPNAIGGGGTYRGAFQFMRSTWRTSPRSPGGDPIDYSYKTQALRRRSARRCVRARSPWPSCG